MESPLLFSRALNHRERANVHRNRIGPGTNRQIRDEPTLGRAEKALHRIIRHGNGALNPAGARMSPTRVGGMMRRIDIFAARLAMLTALALPAVARAETVGECVPFARAMSGIGLYGDAWTWWDQAAGHYARGRAARVGAVLVFRPSGAMRLGHLAVVSRIVGPHIVMVTHANWSRIGGVRGQVERDVTMVDVSSGHDWSAVRVWYDTNAALGGSTYPTYGFVYGTPDPAAPAGTRTASPAPNLSGPAPDIIGAVLDSVG
jgi:surface antigen